nr:uncharacterized protein LOC110378406 [Helicoverpa armigera]
MLRHRGSVLLTILTFVSLSSEQLSYSDGWVPVSHHAIYNQLRRESTHYPVYLTTKHPIHHDYLNLVENEINSRREIRNFMESMEFINEKPVESITEVNTLKEVDKTEENRKEFSRKAKKVRDHDSDVNIDTILAKTNIDTEVKHSSKDDPVNDILNNTPTAKTYEVTEDTDKDFPTEDNTTTEYGYEYKSRTNKPQNLTSTFYQILSKYNINNDDNLQNYDLSLRNKVQNAKRAAYRIPLPYRYNSLDHLPVDPLLAVFLSNYGFYLPSLYGINANYNNLYGYLASNNIHNNKPFGLYKIFSDTDSWN